MKRAGMTLIELMLVSAIISIGILGIVGSFKYFNWGIQSAKGKSLANNLAQEKIEVLKNKSYYRILVTSATAEDTNFSPSLTYDTHPNGIETLNVGGMEFKRMVYIRKVSENASGNLIYYSWTTPDTGLKEILVYVVWKEGSDWKKAELRNLRDNPDRTALSATFTGKVEEEGALINLSSVVVRAQENPSRLDETDGLGDYSFLIEPGSYTLRASKTGYFPKTSSVLSINTNDTKTENFTLRKMSTGTITGSVFMRDHLVISQVVGSSVTVYGDTEWVEVFNPTTWTWTMATGLGTGTNEIVHFRYKESAESEIIPDIDYRSTAIAPNSYFLFANTGTIVAAGVIRTADAVYDSDFNLGTMDDVIKTGNPSAGGYVILGRYATLQEYDKVGWNATNNGNGAKKYAESFEGTAIVQDFGFQVSEEYTRKTTSSGINPSLGRCHDTQNNENDFVDTIPIINQPHNSTDSQTCASGTPAYGAIVYADDGLSTPVTAEIAGDFTLINVATGYWTVYASSGSYFISSGTYGGTAAGFSASTPSLLLSSSTAYGYVSGRVTNVSGSPINGIVMYVSGFYTNTVNGNYILPSAPGTVNVIANYQTADTSYVETSSMNVIVNLGQTTKNVDIILLQGGKIRGRVTTGVDPLPNIPITASKSSVVQGDGISGSDGYFNISNLSTGTYAVTPQLESGESSAPSTFTAVISAGSDLFVGTFTVSGAMGYISGQVISSGTLVTTGVLIYATTTTITGNPPVINSTLRGGSNIYYGISSDAEGNFILPVRGGYTYNLYGWYTTWGGDTPYTTPKSTTSVVVPAGQTVTRSLSW